MLFLPPISGTKYGYFFFLGVFLVFYLPRYSVNNYFSLLIILIVIISMTKSLYNTSFLRESVVSIIYIVAPLSALFVGSEFGKFETKFVRFFVSFLFLILAILCFFQISNRSFGLLTAMIFTSGDKYTGMYLRNSEVRSIGTFGNPNYLGFFFFVGLTLLSGFYKKTRNIWYFCLWLLLACAIITTGSRAAFIFTLVYYFIGPLISLMVNSFRGKSLLFVFILFFIVAIGTVVILYRYELLSYISSLVNRPSDTSEVFSVRYEGWNNFDLDTNNYFMLLFGTTKPNLRVTLDNLYLSTLSRYGLIGSLIVFIVFSLALIRLGKATGRAKYTLDWLFLLYLSGLVADYWFNPFYGTLYLLLIGYSYRTPQGVLIKKR